MIGYVVVAVLAFSTGMLAGGALWARLTTRPQR